MGSRSSSEGPRPRCGGYGVVVLVVVAAAWLFGGCVTVRPEDKEFLADPSMTFGSEGEAGAHEDHVFNNREGSFGGGGVGGGGCGCN